MWVLSGAKRKQGDSGVTARHADDTDRRRHAPTINDDGTITLYGVRPTCSGCGGPTHAVTGDDDAERPWWCEHCNVWFDDAEGYGAQAWFPSGDEPSLRDSTDDRHDERD